LHVVATGERRGAEVFASDLARSLADLGVDQRVVVLHGSVVHARFPAAVETVGGSHRLPGVRLDPRAIRRLRRIVTTWDPHVVQVHGGEALKHSVAALAGSPRAIVYRRIGLAPTAIIRGPRRIAYAALMRAATRVVAVANSVRMETVDRFRVPPSRVVTIPNAVDPRRIAPTRDVREVREALGLSESSRIVLSVGAITWEKDPLAHLAITSRVLRERAAVHVWLGDGPMRAIVRAAADRAGLDGRFVLVGGRTDVGDLVAAADVVLFASRTDGMEGMPAVAIEAGMAGVPVAGFDVAGISEVVADGTTGCLVPPGDVEEAARRVVELLDDDERRAEMGRAARERCLTRFDIRSIARRYYALYEGVIKA
jgi:glycosyltransferase involved in cell wall biosynthesis